MMRELAAAFVLVSCVAAGAEEDPGTYFPFTSHVLLTVRDVKVLLAALEDPAGNVAPSKPDQARTDVLRKAAQVADGRVCLAFARRAEDRRGWAFLLRAPVNETNFTADDVIKEVLSLVGMKGEMAPGTDPVREFRAAERDKARLFWKVHNGVLYLSNDREQVRSVGIPPPPERPGMTVTEIPMLDERGAYHELGKHVDWKADVTVFGNLAGLSPKDFCEELWIFVEPKTKWLGDWLSLRQFGAVGFSLGGDGERTSARLAVLTARDRKGLARLLDLPNAPLGNLDRIPEKAHGLVASSAITRDLPKRLARFMADLDPDIAKEFEEDLAEFSKELRVDLAKDFLGNLGTSVFAAGKTEGGGSACYGVIETPDTASLQRAAEALAKYNRTPLRKEQHSERTYLVIPAEPPVYYAFADNRLYLSGSTEAVEEMLALKDGDKSLASSGAAKKLLGRLPAESVFTAACDSQWLARAAMQEVVVARRFRDIITEDAVRRLLEPLAKAPPGLSLGVALRNEPDAFVLHMEVTAAGATEMLQTVIRFVGETVQGALRRQIEALKEAVPK